MQANQALQAYWLWLKERGLRYPVVGQARTVDGVQPDASCESSVALQVQECRACALRETSAGVSWGYGGSSARVLFVGDLPTLVANQAGAAFMGDERTLLDRMIAAMQLRPEDTFVTNAVLCPSPSTPLPPAASVEACRQNLQAIAKTIAPEIVVTLGAVATRMVLGMRDDFQSLRGRFHQSVLLGDRLVLPTFHPRDLLRFPPNKRLAWSDLQIVMDRLGLVRKELQ